MKQNKFTAYTTSDKNECLGLFDANCPEYFAPDEKSDYKQFLEGNPVGYKLLRIDGEIVAAFGLIGFSKEDRSLNWIIAAPRLHGKGLGREIMENVLAEAEELRLKSITIAASHKSAPFFMKYGAVVRKKTLDGWGIGMHRIDMKIVLADK